LGSLLKYINVPVSVQVER